MDDRIDPDQFTGWIRHEAERFHTVAETADPDAPVPSCPGWTVADLVWHLGEVHWFWASVVERRATDPEAVEADKPARPTDPSQLTTWARSQSERLLATLDVAEDSTPVWTWSPPHQDVGFVRRHQVQETAVHRWDLDTATGQDTRDLEALAASDAIDEVLAVTLPWGIAPDRPLIGSVHLHCTDVEGEWIIDADGSVRPIHAKGDAAIRGRAWDLLLLCFGRIDVSAVEVIGDGSVAADFLARLNTT